ncbi:MAG: RNA polymerase sigma factor [Sulfobacillus sp.]
MSEVSQVDAWVIAWGDKLVKFAALYTHDPDLAQDIAQETFIELYRLTLRQPDLDIHPGWLYRVARNKIRDYARRKMLSGKAASVSEGSAVSDGWTVRVLVQDALVRLSRMDQECLWLFYYLDLPVDEISSLLRIPPASVRGRLYRARRRFKAIWGDDQ